VVYLICRRRRRRGGEKKRQCSPPHGHRKNNRDKILYILLLPSLNWSLRCSNPCKKQGLFLPPVSECRWDGSKRPIEETVVVVRLHIFKECGAISQFWQHCLSCTITDETFVNKPIRYRNSTHQCNSIIKTMFCTRFEPPWTQFSLGNSATRQSTKNQKEVVTREKQELKLCTKLWLLSIFYQQATLSISFPHRLKEANSFLPVHSWMLSTTQQYRKSAWNDELTCKRRRHGHAVDQSLDVITMSTPPRRQRLPRKRRQRTTSRNKHSCVSFGATEASLSAPETLTLIWVRVRVSGEMSPSV